METNSHAVIYRTNDDVQHAFRWQVPADTTPDRNPRRGHRGRVGLTSVHVNMESTLIPSTYWSHLMHLD